MVVIPEQPLVLAADGSTVIVLARVLTCTRNAIKELFQDTPRHSNPARYKTIVSKNELAMRVLDHATENPNQAFDFDPTSMDPADYIALAVETFYNETFRAPLNQL